MKFFLFLLFIPLILSSQNKRDSIAEERYFEKKRCEELNEEDRKLFLKLKKEASNIDFDALTLKIIENISAADFKYDCINFYVQSSKLECGAFSNYDCERKYNTKNPFYNLNFWTIEDLQYLNDKLKTKTIILSHLESGFGYANSFDINTEKYSKNYLKKLRKGRFKDTNEEFYYLSKDKKDFSPASDILKSYLSISITTFLENKAVIVVQTDVFKKRYMYQYNNSEWDLIEKT